MARTGGGLSAQTVPNLLPNLRASRAALVVFGFALAFLATLASPRIAFAAPSGGAAQVLTFEADEGSEEQADALSGALRARVRSAPGWTLGDTTNSLSMMSAALKCSSKTDGACLQKIGDQLKADKFFWGLVTKAPNKQLIADVHLWQRGKPDSITRETFSDNLKDQNDETLQRIAARIFEKLTGVAGATLPPAMGAIAIHAGGDATGEVFIDTKRVGHVDKGEGRVEIRPGTYIIELRAAGFKPSRQSVAVPPGGEAVATLTMVAEPGALVPPPTEPEGGGSGRKILGWGLVGVGVAGVVVGVVEAIRWGSLQGKLNDDKKGTDGRGNYDVVGPSVSDPCAQDTTPATHSACDTNKSAKTTSTVAWLASGVGVAALGVGAVLLLTDTKSASVATQGTNRPLRPRVLPYAGPQNGGVDLRWSF
jgi:hypothetical protein